MAGGGEGAFIGAVHRLAAQLDGEWQLVCGAFSSEPERNRRSAAVLGLPCARAYDDFATMLKSENALPADQRMQALIVATPNHLHRPMAVAALEAGFAVLSDKPVALNLAEAREIADAAAASAKPYGVTYTYAGYPMIEEARSRVASGDLGEIRRVDVEYRQGWLSTDIDATGQKQAAWRTDPAKAGVGGALGDIGTHAFHLAELVSGLTVTELCADITAHVEGRRLDDDASILLRFQGGARGSLVASQICAGEENAIQLRIAGELGTMSWRQEEPNSLVIRWRDRPIETIRTGGAGGYASASSLTRLPAGHPEGYIEAFANIYRGFASAVRDGRQVSPAPGQPGWFPGIADGLRGMAFVEAAVQNSKSNDHWTAIAI